MNELNFYNEIKALDTEQRNPASENIDILSTREILEVINNEDAKIAPAVKKELDSIAAGVDLVSNAFAAGGRLFYFGAGTSGRLGIVDASECPPTFGVDSGMVVGLIAGGGEAVFQAQEGAEDDEFGCVQEFDKYNINENDIVCSIAASGRTPYVIGALKEAKKRNIKTIFISLVSKEKLAKYNEIADVIIAPSVGPEVITGSTRMKAGTAQKMILNMLTTASMIRIGKTYGNIMVDLMLTNQKLYQRAKRIIIEITGCDYNRAEELVGLSNGKVKNAILMEMLGCDFQVSETLLKNNDGIIKNALNSNFNNK